MAPCLRWLLSRIQGTAATADTHGSGTGHRDAAGGLRLPLCGRSKGPFSPLSALQVSVERAAVELLVHEANAYAEQVCTPAHVNTCTCIYTCICVYTNACAEQLGTHTRFEVEEEFTTTAAGHRDLHDASVKVADL